MAQTVSNDKQKQKKKKLNGKRKEKVNTPTTFS